MRSDTTSKNTTPLKHDPALVALVLLAIALQALLLALRPLLAHALALVLTVAGYRPTQKESAAPKPQPIKTTTTRTPQRQRRTRRHAPVAA